MPNPEPDKPATMTSDPATRASTGRSGRWLAVVGAGLLLVLLALALAAWLAISRPALWLPVLNRQLPSGMEIVAATGLRPGPARLGWQRIEMRWHDQTMVLEQGHARWQIHRLRPLEVTLQQVETRQLRGRLGPPAAGPPATREPLPRFWEQPWWPVLSALSGNIEHLALSDHEGQPLVDGALDWQQGAQRGQATLHWGEISGTLQWQPVEAAPATWQAQWRTEGALQSEGTVIAGWRDERLAFRLNGDLHGLPADGDTLPVSASGHADLFAISDRLLIADWEAEGRQRLGTTPLDWHCHGSVAVLADLALHPELSHCELTSTPVAGKLLGPVTLDWPNRAIHWQQDLELKLVGPFVSGALHVGGEGCELDEECRLPVRLELYSGSWDDWAWEGGQADTRLSLSLDNNRVQLDSARIRLDAIAGHGLRIPELTLDTDTVTLWQPDLEHWQVARIDWAVSARLDDPEAELAARGQVRDLVLTDARHWAAQLELAADPRWQDHTFPTLYLDQQWQGTPEQFTASGTLESGLLGTLLEHRLILPHEGSPQLTGRIDSGHWPEGADIIAGVLGRHSTLVPLRELHGDIRADLTATWTEEGPRLDLRGQAGELAGLFDQYAFAGVRIDPFHLRWRDGGLSTVTPLQWQLAAFNIGLEITALQGALSVAPGGWHLSDTRGELLGGRFRVDRFDLDNGGRVALESLDLGAAVALMNQPDIRVTGQISGELPVALEDGAPVVRGGHLRNDGSGVIRYRPDPASDFLRGNPQTALVGDTLSNLHYQRLEAEVDYRANGDLLLFTRLEGRNPDLAGSPPIHLNLNVEQNIPSLLRSLRAGEDIGAWLERRVQPRR